MQLIRAHSLGVRVMPYDVAQSHSNFDRMRMSIPRGTGPGRFALPVIIDDFSSSPEARL